MAFCCMKKEMIEMLMIHNYSNKKKHQELYTVVYKIKIYQRKKISEENSCAVMSITRPEPSLSL